jgi:flagellar basal-body rod protein FlgG
MMRSLWSAASGMLAQQTNLDTVANNLANVNTVGYKKDTTEFKSLLYQTLQSPSTNSAGENKPVPAQVGLGTRVSSITTVFTQGNLQEADDNTSFAIEGDGFFKVKNQDGDILYTRDGSFATQPVDGGVMLCTSDGYPVLDQNNNTIVIPSTYSVDSFTVDTEGNLSVRDGNGDTVALTQTLNGQAYNQKIGLVQFNNPSGLDNVGGNMYQVTVASGNPLEESTNQGLKTSRIHQSYLEMSNVQVADEMVNMIVAQRAYEMNSKAIQASDTMLDEANNLRR